MNAKEIKKLIEQNKLNVALQTLENTLADNPNDVEALNLSAFIYFHKGNFSKAIKLFEQAAGLLENPSAGFVNLGIVYFQMENIEKALDYFSRAVEADESNAPAHYNYALALSEIGEIEKAIREYERTIELNDKYHSAYLNLSMLYLLTGEYENGWRYYEYRFLTDELKRKELPGKRWRGEEAKDKTLYVYSDQGFGDLLQFVRLLKIAKKKVGTVILEAQIELLELLKNSGVADRVVPSRPDFSATANYDLQIPLMSLPYALDINDDNIPQEIPYIKPDKEKVERWKSLLDVGDKMKIGIAWRGNPAYKKNHLRSTIVNNFKPLLNWKKAVFFSLQKDIYEREKEFLLANGVVDLSEYLRDFSETAAIMENLDLIITTDTVIPHLAGVLGKPVWTLLSYVPDWRWGMSDDRTKWYPQMKLFRQKERGKWKPVFEEVNSELSKLLTRF